MLITMPQRNVVIVFSYVMAYPPQIHSWLKGCYAPIWGNIIEMDRSFGFQWTESDMKCTCNSQSLGIVRCGHAPFILSILLPIYRSKLPNSIRPGLWNLLRKNAKSCESQKSTSATPSCETTPSMAIPYRQHKRGITWALPSKENSPSHRTSTTSSRRPPPPDTSSRETYGAAAKMSKIPATGHL